MIRLTSLTLAMAAFTGLSLNAMEVDPQTGGLVFGNDKAKDYSFNAFAGLANKQIDQGWERDSNAVLQTGGTARYWGLGLTLFGSFAIEPDSSATYVSTVDPTVYGPNPLSPGEFVQFNAKLDYVIEVDGVYGVDQPFLQFIPHFEYVTYPNQPANVLKDDQVWAGADVWWSTPLEGIEIGGNSDWNLLSPAYRGAAGFREVLQFAPYDLVLWQVANWGSNTYQNYFYNSETTGFTTTDIGAKVRMPMAWREWWTYVGADWSYWVTQSAREARGDFGLNAGTFEFNVGMEWIAE